MVCTNHNTITPFYIFVSNISIGNTWDVEVGFGEEAKLQYKYFVKVDETKDVRWEDITHRYDPPSPLPLPSLSLPLIIPAETCMYQETEWCLKTSGTVPSLLILLFVLNSLYCYCICILLSLLLLLYEYVFYTPITFVSLPNIYTKM